MNYNKFIKVFKEQYGEIKTNEIMEAGFSFADITKLVNAKILRKSVRGIYILDYKNDVNDYLKMAKKSENTENLSTALYYYNMAEWLNDDERMPFIYYRKLWLLISMDNYSEALSTIEKLINMKNSEKYYGVINITLKLLSELHEIDPKLIAKTDGRNIAIKSDKITKESLEYLNRALYNIDKGCYAHAEYLINKAMELSDNQPFYVFKLFSVLLSKVCDQKKEEADSFTEEGKDAYNAKIRELDGILDQCISSYDFISAKKIVEQQLRLVRSINPNGHNLYYKVILEQMLDTVIALNNGTLENIEYSFEGMDLSDKFVFFRSLEVNDFNQAIQNFVKSDGGFSRNINNIFAYWQVCQPENLDTELQSLIDTEDISNIKEYVETSNLSAYNKAMEYLRIARICYQEDKLDFGDQISSLVKPNTFRAIKYQGPLRQEKNKVQSIKEIKIRKREK